jgi:hypothetical protein
LFEAHSNKERSSSYEKQNIHTLKRKSAAHHMMFDQSTAPWGVERTQGSVPQIKQQVVDPDEFPAAGMKTYPRDIPQQIHSSKNAAVPSQEQEKENTQETIKELQRDLSN